MLYYSTSKFMELFVSFDVQLPSATRMLVTNYRWLLPVWFGGAVLLMVAKQYFVRENAINLTITFATTITMSVLSGQIVRMLYQPILGMSDKLNK